MTAKTDGALLWCSKEVERVNAVGGNYIRYESGLQICWGSLVTESNGGKYLMFPVPFSVQPFVVANVGAEYQEAAASYATVFPGMLGNGLACNIWTRYNNSLQANMLVLWIAVGVWK